MNHLNRCLENIEVSHADCGGQVQEVLEAKTVSKWARDCSCETLAKNVAAFYPCPNGFLCLVISNQVCVGLQ